MLPVRKTHTQPPTVIFSPSVGRNDSIIQFSALFLDTPNCPFSLVVPNCPVPNCPGAKLCQIVNFSRPNPRLFYTKYFCYRVSVLFQYRILLRSNPIPSKKWKSNETVKFQTEATLWSQISFGSTTTQNQVSGSILILTKTMKMIMAMTVSVSVSEAKRMLKIVAKLVVGLAKALAPTVICHKLWTMGIGN